MKLLIVDDDALIRDSLRIMCELEEDIEVAGCASNGQEAFEMCRQLHPDIVLMDIRMPVLDGVLGTKLIKENFKDIKVIILTTFKDDEYIKEAIKNGAEGYVLKNQPFDSLAESLRAVYRGNAVFDKSVAKTIYGMIKEENKKRPKDFDISDRDYEIIKLISEGLSNKEIAEKLYLSEGTVRNYITNLLSKLNLRDRTQLAIFYFKNLS
ncbi:response regulator transcription factor [Caloramator sp. E03]|uniref:response regulator transcription factor n=1 Tax=Caloramator sp. E03 TaxID=2576307 RepID=UPI001110DF16|nr:response regulator transcription factor [Caloramator sp. E03]QCX33163.1 response regulator transcription factor [Caloramator sp. E03]